MYSVFMTRADLFNNEDTVVLRSMVCPFTGTNWIYMKYFILFIKTLKGHMLKRCDELFSSLLKLI